MPIDVPKRNARHSRLFRAVPFCSATLWMLKRLQRIASKRVRVLHLETQLLLRGAPASQPENRRTESAIGRPTPSQCSTNSATMGTGRMWLGPMAESGKTTSRMNRKTKAP